MLSSAMMMTMLTSELVSAPEQQGRVELLKKAEMKGMSHGMVSAGQVVVASEQKRVGGRKEMKRRAAVTSESRRLQMMDLQEQPPQGVSEMPVGADPDPRRHAWRTCGLEPCPPSHE